MSPAFRSTGHAAAFAALLGILLAMPAILPISWLPPIEQAYDTESWESSPYPWIKQQIFEERGEIDMAFMGSSHIHMAIDTPYVQEELSKKLGRPAFVRTLAWGGAGYDVLYFTARELMRHRKVHTLVIYDENPTGNQRNILSPTWFRWGADSTELAGLPFKEKALFYLTSILSTPRTLLSLLRPNLPAGIPPKVQHEQEAIYHAPNVATRLGSFSAAVGFNPSLDAYDFTRFVSYAPPIGVLPDKVEVYSANEKGSFQFSNESLPAWQSHFARKLAALARGQGSQLVMLHIPLVPEMRETAIRERLCWPEYLYSDWKLVGIPPGRLFQNLSDTDVLNLFANHTHFNRNGMIYFTKVITPTLLRIYDTPNKP
jgi:hypothetical protein